MNPDERIKTLHEYGTSVMILILVVQLKHSCDREYMSNRYFTEIYPCIPPDKINMKAVISIKTLLDILKLINGME